MKLENKAPSYLKQALTESDNETYDLGPLSVFATLIAMIIFQAFTLSSFSAVSFGGGVAAILTAGGAHKLMKGKAEAEESD